MTYKRVIPRDLFNEAKLLKCLGQLALVVHDKTCKGLPIDLGHQPFGFNIEQNPDDGSLYCSNFKAFLHGDEIELFTPLNSKKNYPIIGRYRGGEYYLFDENGKFMTNFGLGEK